MRVLSVKRIERPYAQSMSGMGAVPQPVLSDFFPSGETFDWYNPVDIARQAEYDAALAAWNFANGVAGAGQQLANAALTEALKVAAGIVALKLTYDYFSRKKPSKRK